MGDLVPRHIERGKRVGTVVEGLVGGGEHSSTKFISMVYKSFSFIGSISEERGRPP